MKRTNIFAVTENGETRYCETKIYGGLSGVALRLCLNANDEHGTPRPLFGRLDRVKEISEADWREIAEAPHRADDYYSFIMIDADKNIVSGDEDWPEERRHVEVPLDKLLETAAPLIEKHRYSGYPSLDKTRLYSFLRRHFINRDALFMAPALKSNNKGNAD